MKKPVISVVMPVYNAGKFLSEAIDSILHQTFTDFEFIIINDGSTDNSAAIVHSYNDDRIVFLENETNLGIMASLNRGIAHAQADLVARMDADDVSVRDRLQKQLDFIASHPDGALWSCWANVMSEDKQLIRLEKFKPAYYYFNLVFECWIYHPTIIFSKEKIMHAGGYTVPYAEDYELIWQVSRKFKMYHQPEALLNYRVTGNSLHQFLKKAEYEAAFRGMVQRNIRYYMGPGFEAGIEELECLRHRFTNLSKDDITGTITRSLKILEAISRQVYLFPNPNNVPAHVMEAARHKRLYIIDHFIRTLPRKKAILLAAKTGSWRLLFKITVTHVVRF